MFSLKELDVELRLPCVFDSCVPEWHARIDDAVAEEEALVSEEPEDDDASGVGTRQPLLLGTTEPMRYKRR